MGWDAWIGRPATSMVPSYLDMKGMSMIPTTRGLRLRALLFRENSNDFWNDFGKEIEG